MNWDHAIEVITPHVVKIDAIRIWNRFPCILQPKQGMVRDCDRRTCRQPCRQVAGTY